MTTHVLSEIETGFHRAALLRRPRRHLVAVLSIIAAVIVVTVAIALLKPIVPVISLASCTCSRCCRSRWRSGSPTRCSSSVACMLAFNWFFLPPVHSFTLADSRNWLVLAVFLVTAVVVSLQAARSRQRAVDAEQREVETAVIARLGDVAAARRNDHRQARRALAQHRRGAGCDAGPDRARPAAPGAGRASRRCR